MEAIFPEVDVPLLLEPDVALDALVRDRRTEFRVPVIERREASTAAAVDANKGRWGLGTK